VIREAFSRSTLARVPTYPPWLVRAQRLVSSPVYATFTTVLAVVAGLLGSAYQDDVATAFPMVLRGPWGPVSFRAAIFWTSVVLFAVLFFFRQWWDDVNRERTASRAEQGTERLEALVRTMPPRAFQTQLARMVQVTHGGMEEVLPRQKPPEFNRDGFVNFVRGLLNAIARLALLYDDQPLTPDGSATYSANVMLFVPRPSEGTLSKELLFALRFHPSEYDLTKLAGILILRPELSATSEEAELPGPDTAVPAIVLPVPAEAMSGGRWNALPGAPKAFLTREVDGYDDATTLAEWCRERGNFPPSVVEAVRDYFTAGEGGHIRSFISRPLLSNDGRPLGVLNLHSNRKGILGNADERLSAFLAMLTPLLLDLQSALEILGDGDGSTAPVTLADKDH